MSALLDWVRGRSPRWDEVVYWSLDLETSGLESGSDEILAVGMVPIRGGAIHWGERYYSLVRPARPELLSTAGIAAHHLLPGDLEGAPPVQEVLPAIEERLADAVLLVHFASIDMAFLQRASARAHRPWRRRPVVDTVELIGRLHRRAHYLEPHPEDPSTRLDEARRRLGLPPHDAHHALGDALATAELFLAIRARLDASTLRDLQ